MLESLPNAHPALIHFPLALFATALGIDVAMLIWFRTTWLDRAAVMLYALAALGSGAAAISGKLAADGLVPALSEDTAIAVSAHADWAFASVLLLFGVAGLRLESMMRDREASRPRRSRVRMLALVLAVGAQWVLVRTADRGGGLVYRHGVGVEALGGSEP